jgi:hypothetical protein
MLKSLVSLLILIGLAAWAVGCESSSDCAEADAVVADTVANADTCGPTGPAPFGLTITRLFCDEQGESHFEDYPIGLVEYEFVAGAPKVNISAPGEAASYIFLEANEGWRAGMHPTLNRQISVVVRGGLKVLASDGTERTFAVGDMILSEDVSTADVVCKGHESIPMGQGSNMLLMVGLPAATE